MANLRAALARGFSAAVVVIFLAVGGYVLVSSRTFTRQGLFAYLLVLSFALTGARGIWTDRYRVAAVGTLGTLGTAALLTGFAMGLAFLLVVALALGWSGREPGSN
ncbi:hypothetical protein BRC82_07605 [Halobacteriales archaeon QS_1_67_19]|nr:MAG: hypothetical protein BRC82_07605 [Halobacteriales archaeon QS_1_67_19]